MSDDLRADGTADAPPPAPTQHDHSRGIEGCPACNRPAITAEDEAVIQQDAATRSLSQALSTSFTLFKIIMVAFFAFFALKRFTFVEQGTVGIKQRFGEYVRDDETGRITQYQPGEIVFVWPEPIETWEILPLAQDRELVLDTAFFPKIENRQAIKEDQELPPAESLNPTKDGYNLTGDLNILHSRWVIHYRIDDPEAYVLSTARIPNPKGKARIRAEGIPPERWRQALADDAWLTPDDILRRVARSVILRNIAGTSVEDAYNQQTGALFDRITADIKAAIERRDPQTGRPVWGISIKAVNSKGIYPPGKTDAAFKAVTSALSRQEKLKDAARAEAEKTLEAAHAEKNRILNDARNYRKAVVSQARGDEARLRDLVSRFPDDPGRAHVFLQQYHVDLLRQILGGVDRKYLLAPGQRWLMLAPDVYGQQNDENKKQP